MKQQIISLLERAKENGRTIGDVLAEVRGLAAKPAASAELVAQYYHRVNECPTLNASSAECICWHDKGTGPHPDARVGDIYNGVTLTWRHRSNGPIGVNVPAAPPAADERAPVGDERAAFKKCHAAIIKAISSIARADGSDTRKEDDPELLYRSPVMDEVVRIRGALDECSAALASAPSAGQQPIVHQHGFAADNQRLRAINESLDKQLEEVMTERDNREDVIDKLLDIVLGADRSEWSSEYGYGRAVIEVEERMHALASAPVAGEGQPVAYRVLRKTHDGDWKDDGRCWCDGAPSADLKNDIAQRADRWRIEYAYTAPQASPAADGRDAKDAERYRWLRDPSNDGPTLLASCGPDELDSALDAAIAAQQGEGGK